MAGIRGNNHSQDSGAGTSHDEQGALGGRGLRPIGGGPDPDHFTGIGLAVHIGGKEDRPRVVSSGFDSNARRLARLRAGALAVNSQPGINSGQASIKRIAFAHPEGAQQRRYGAGFLRVGQV